MKHILGIPNENLASLARGPSFCDLSRASSRQDFALLSFSLRFPFASHMTD